MDNKLNHTIHQIFQSAHNDSRQILYEHEVYKILSLIGLDVPQCIFLTEISAVDESVLNNFRSPNLMLKLVSRDLSHNQRFGGVKKITMKDPLFIQFAMERMKSEVLSHFPDDKKPSIDGFIICEFIKFTQALGNELLIGLKEDPGFGCVITLSKGGDDAEFFARYYDPANLLLAPVSLNDAQEITQKLKIRHKYDDEKHVNYMPMLAQALTSISQLGHNYSFMSSNNPEFHIKALDVNPLVFSEDGRFVAIDGYAEFEKVNECTLTSPGPDISNLASFFNPQGVAILGVSSDPQKYSLAKVIAQLFIDLGRTDFYCVNPKGGNAQIAGLNYTLYESLKDIPEHVDLVVYAAPAKNSLRFLETVSEDKAVILISGFPPDMDYTNFLQAITVRKKGIRLIGPNCMGVFYAPEGDNPGVNTLFIDENRLKLSYNDKSNVALFTQSGAMGISMIERTQHSRIIRTIISFGNKADVTFPDLMAYFENHPNIDVMSLYIEGILPGEGRQFFDIACRRKKPMIVYKSGRTLAGVKAAASHTASMSGSYDVFKAACEQARCVLTEDLDDFYNYTKAFAMLSKKNVKGNRVAGVVNAGLDATMGADTLHFLEQTTLSKQTIQKIRDLNTHGLVDINTSFLDVTPMTDDTLYAQFLDALVQDDNVDCLFVALVPHIENLKTVESDYLDEGAIVVKIAEIATQTEKPIVVSINAGNHYQHLVAYLENHGVPVYTNIHAAIRSLDTFIEYRSV